jgi:SAM-dependent methyltransferase
VRQARWDLRILRYRQMFGLALVDDYIRDRRVAGWVGGTDRLRNNPAGANFFSSTHYWELRRIFSAEYDLAITADDVLVDVGCGRGRILSFWLQAAEPARVVGIEIDPALAEQARTHFSHRPDVEILCGDGAELLPLDTTVCWLFNPFTDDDAGRECMVRLAARLSEARGLGPVRVVLFRPRHVDVFESDPRWHVRRFTFPRFLYSVAVVTPTEHLQTSAGTTGSKLAHGIGHFGRN